MSFRRPRSTSAEGPPGPRARASPEGSEHPLGHGYEVTHISGLLMRRLVDTGRIPLAQAKAWHAEWDAEWRKEDA